MLDPSNTRIQSVYGKSRPDTFCPRKLPRHKEAVACKKKWLKKKGTERNHFDLIKQGIHGFV